LAAAAPLARVRAQTPLVIGVPGPGSTVSLPVEVLVKRGFDRAEGLAVRPRFVGGGGVVLRDLADGNADYGVFGLPAAMNQNLRGARYVALAAIDDLPLYTLVVRADLRGAIRRIEDLRGRTVGIHSNGLATRTTSHQLLDLVLASHGVPADSVRIVAAGQSWETQTAALRSGSIDASMCDEPIATRLEAAGLAHTLYSTGNPGDARATPGAGFLRAALIGLRSRVDAQPDEAARVVAMFRRTLGWLAQATPVQVADTLAPGSDDERAALLAVLTRFRRQYSRDGTFSRAQLRDTDAFFRASNADNPAAQAYSVASMVIDRWVGQRD
jgi:NitT/TauT family transport system substrate-binding protein